MNAGVLLTDDGCRLVFDVEGPDGGPPVVLLHALGTGRMLWDAVVPALAATRRVVRLEFRGHGGSDAPGTPYALERLGRDVVALLDLLGVEAACVVGVSLGGLVAQRLALHAPSRVRGVVLANTAARIGDPALWSARIAAVRADGLAPLVDGALGRWFTQAFLAAHPDVEQRYRQQLLATSVEGYAAACAVLRDSDLRAEITRVATPTVVIGGTQDVATPPSDAAWLAAEIRGASLVVLEAAHLAHVEQPDAFLAAIRPALDA